MSKNLPTVNFSADRTQIAEGGEAQLLTFNLSEPAPAGGLVVNIDIDDPDGEGADTEFPPELISNIVDFGQVEEDGTITASLTIAEGETEATFGISAIEDNLDEGGETYSLTLLDGENYIADPDSTTITTTIEDNMTLPTVSITPENVSVSEGETFSWNISLDAPAPEEGLALSLPIIFNNDPAPGDVEYNIDGSSGITDFEFVLGEGISESFNLTIAEGETEAVLVSQAVSDEIEEADETFTIAIAEGDSYLVDADNSEVTTTISDVNTSTDFPTISVVAEPTEVEEDSQLRWNFSLSEAVAEGGLTVALDLVEDTDPLPGDIEYFVEESKNVTDFELIIDEESGLIDRALVTLAEGATEATLVNDIIADNVTEGEESVSFALAESEAYSIDSEDNVASFTILDTSTDTSTDFPTISVVAEPTEVEEGSQLRWNFSLSEAVAEGGLTVALDLVEDTDPLPGDIEYFVEESKNVTDFELIIDEESGLIDRALVTLAEGATEATLVNDIIADNVTEGEESVSFALAEFEAYSIDSEDNVASFTILDTSTDISTVLSPVFGTTEGDTLEIDSSDRLVFAGDSNDLIDAVASEGGNRIYGGSGDDTVVLGENDRIFGEEGSDRFFAASGGNNIITGGASADQFWIATAEIPESANIITDFTAGEDVIGIAGLGIGFEDLTLTQTDADVLIAANGSDLTVLSDINAGSLSEDNFTFS